jgi:hypothetical protein
MILELCRDTEAALYLREDFWLESPKKAWKSPKSTEEEARNRFIDEHCRTAGVDPASGHATTESLSILEGLGTTTAYATCNAFAADTAEALVAIKLYFPDIAAKDRLPSPMDYFEVYPDDPLKHQFRKYEPLVGKFLVQATADLAKESFPPERRDLLIQSHDADKADRTSIVSLASQESDASGGDSHTFKGPSASLDGTYGLNRTYTGISLDSRDGGVRLDFPGGRDRLNSHDDGVGLRLSVRTGGHPSFAPPDRKVSLSPTDEQVSLSPTAGQVSLSPAKGTVSPTSTSGGISLSPLSTEFTTHTGAHSSLQSVERPPSSSSNETHESDRLGSQAGFIIPPESEHSGTT